MKKYNKNYNKININSSSKNMILSNKYNHDLTHYSSNKNIFRKNTSNRLNIKEKIHKYNINSKNKKIYSNIYYDEKENINNNIFKLLNVKNSKECINKINKLLNYENFIHKLKKIYFNFNGNNNDFKLRDILFWISFNLNNEINKKNKINQYEEFCIEIMNKFNISNFGHFKKFFINLINKDKNNNYFVDGMKKLFNNFNNYQLNQTIYKNRSKSNIHILSYGNEDDINNK